MIYLLKIISLVGLALTLIPALLVYLGMINAETNKNLMLIGTICWFLTAPYWMNQKSGSVPIENEKEIKTEI